MASTTYPYVAYKAAKDHFFAGAARPSKRALASRERDPAGLMNTPTVDTRANQEEPRRVEPSATATCPPEDGAGGFANAALFPPDTPSPATLRSTAAPACSGDDL
jgi:hypothetical protein